MQKGETIKTERNRETEGAIGKKERVEEKGKERLWSEKIYLKSESDNREIKGAKKS